MRSHSNESLTLIPMSDTVCFSALQVGSIHPFDAYKVRQESVISLSKYVPAATTPFTVRLSSCPCSLSSHPHGGRRVPQLRKKSSLGEVAGETLASIQPRPLPQHIHTALRFLDGVVQQTLEATLKRPALLHKRLIQLL